jgi:hypothetical protein
MNRKQRRQAQRTDATTRRIRALERRVESTGLPGLIHGMTDACRDCTAGGELILLPGNRMISRVFHDEGCPAAAGITQWEPVPL